MSIHSDAKELARYLEVAEARGIKHGTKEHIGHRTWRAVSGSCGCVFGVVSIIEDKHLERSVPRTAALFFDSLGDVDSLESLFWGLANVSDYVDRADMYAFLLATPASAWEEAARP